MSGDGAALLPELEGAQVRSAADLEDQAPEGVACVDVREHLWSALSRPQLVSSGECSRRRGAAARCRLPTRWLRGATVELADGADGAGDTVPAGV